MNRLLRIWCGGCCIVMMMGCQSVGVPPAVVALPATSAPEIPLRLASLSKVSGCEVTFEDHRPACERQYYPGTCEPRRWRDAMSFVPMESFAPSVEAQLRQRAAAAVASISPQTIHATLTLESFQFALDQREDIQGEYQAEYVNWAAVKDREDEERQARRDASAAEQQARRDAEADERSHYQHEQDSDQSLGEMVFGEIFQISGDMIIASCRSLFIDMPRLLSRKYATRKLTLAEAQTLPLEITEGKQTGLNCRIHATVIYTDRQGADVKRSIRINRHAPLTADASLKDQTAAFMEAALEEFSSSI